MNVVFAYELAVKCVLTASDCSFIYLFIYYCRAVHVARRVHIHVIHSKGEKEEEEAEKMERASC